MAVCWPSPKPRPSRADTPLPVTQWSCPLSTGESTQELAVQFDRRRECRLLVLPALFDEANKLRRQTVQTMRLLDEAGIDSFLPDLPGTNESLRPLNEQTLDFWRSTAKTAVAHFEATHVLAWRAGALLAPDDLPGWHYAPTSGAKQLRSMLRARSIASREAGKQETLSDLQELGRSEGIELAGWRLNAEMFATLESAAPNLSELQRDIAQRDIGGAGLWLRAEPDEDATQAAALAALIAGELTSNGATE